MRVLDSINHQKKKKLNSSNYARLVEGMAALLDESTQDQFLLTHRIIS